MEHNVRLNQTRGAKRQMLTIAIRPNVPLHFSLGFYDFRLRLSTATGYCLLDRFHFPLISSQLSHLSATEIGRANLFIVP